MTAGDWAQVTVGVIGVLATLFVARLVYRLESRDRQTERAEAAAIAERAQAEASERERKAVQREQHKDDFKAATDALDLVEKVFEEVRQHPLSYAEFNESGLDEAREALKRISQRIAPIESAIDSVWFSTVRLTNYTFPVSSSWKHALAGDDANPERLARVVREAVQSGVSQHLAASEGLRAVTAARKAIADQWS